MITAKTIPEARSLALEKIIMCGYVQHIQRGSFENECFRIQLPYLALRITNHTFDRVPVPPTEDWVPEMTLTHGENYYNQYILGSEPPATNEKYTYSTRLNGNNQLAEVIQILWVTPNTNQAVIEVGRPEDIDLTDPACLRLIQFIYDGKQLNIHSYWRSHDVFAGLPENFYGLSRLLEDVAEYTELPVGDFYYYGSCSHIYNYQLDFLGGSE